ncbi:MAG TPA: hypothetical protein EYP14_11525 [Planctomycetaceae bacterium]|nr:hypothetical protein [Planctomycetaceae bacterium]
MSWNKRTILWMAALAACLSARRGDAQLFRVQSKPQVVHRQVVLLTDQPSRQGAVVSGAACPQCYGAAGSCRHGCFVPVVTPVVSWLVNPNAYILSPDHGWSYVIKRPIHRKNITYRRYWPAGWDGKATQTGQTAPLYPVIARPTDTMQMGYYYQHVPTWRPRPGMLPQPPIPSQWNVRKCSPRPDNTYVVWVPLNQLGRGGPTAPGTTQPTSPQPLPQPQVPPAPQKPPSQPPKAAAPARANTASHVLAPSSSR